MNGSLGILLGALLGIPIGIVTNLLTPWIKEKAASLNSGLKQRLEMRKATERVFMTWLAKEPHARTEFLADQRFRILRGYSVLTITYILAALVSTGEWKSPEWVPILLRIFVTLFASIITYHVVTEQSRYRRMLYETVAVNGWLSRTLKKWDPAESRWVDFKSGEDHGSSDPHTFSRDAGVIP